MLPTLLFITIHQNNLNHLIIL